MIYEFDFSPLFLGAVSKEFLHADFVLNSLFRFWDDKSSPICIPDIFSESVESVVCFCHSSQ